MNEHAFKQTVQRIKEVDATIKTLDPSIREAAFKLLEGYITAKAPLSRDTSDTSGGSGGDDGTELFVRHTHEKPSDNAMLAAAYHYSQYGSAPFSADEIRQLADGVAGLTVPARLDMTFAAARRDGRHLFARSGRGAFKPTVHGEKYFKDTYKVSKGNKRKAEAVGSGDAAA